MESENREKFRERESMSNGRCCGLRPAYVKWKWTDEVMDAECRPSKLILWSNGSFQIDVDDNMSRDKA